MGEDEKEERITSTERISLTRQGTSNFFRFPAKWKSTLKDLKRENLAFDFHLEKQDGKIVLIGALVNNDSTRETR